MHSQHGETWQKERWSGTGSSHEVTKFFTLKLLTFRSGKVTDYLLFLLADLLIMELK